MRPLLLLLLSASVLHAEPLLTRTGERYEKCEVTSRTPASVTITHDSGVATLPFAELPDDWQARYGYDAKAAQTWLAGIAAAQHRAYAAQEKARQEKARQGRITKERTAAEHAAAEQAVRELLPFMTNGARMLYDPMTGRVSFSEREAAQAREQALREALGRK